MRSLAISLGIVVAMAAALFGLFHLFGVVDKVAGPIASSMLGFITFVHDKVDKALSSSGKSKVTPGVVPVDEFTIRWPWMLLYASFTVIAINELSELLYSLPVILIMRLNGIYVRPESGLDFFMLILGVMVAPTLAWGLFLLGRWIGIRTARAGYWILPASVILGRGLDLSVMYLSGADEREYMRKVMHTPASIAGLAIVVVLTMGVGLLGVWRGNRIRLGAYFNSLLSKVSAQTRDTLLAMTFEEARAGTPKA